MEGKEREKEKEKEKLFNKGISFFNEELYKMSLYYFIPSKNITNEEIVDNYVKKIKEKISEREKQNTTKQYLNPKERIEEEGKITFILNSTNNYEILNVNKNSTKDEIIKSYKKLIVKYHPDVNSSSKSEELMKKITKAYNKIINGSNSDINPYQLMDRVFDEDDDLVEIMKEEKNDLELKQFTIPPIVKGIGSLFNIGILVIIFVYFIFPYFSTDENEVSTSNLYGFIQTDANPFKKVSKRFKVRYYIGNGFKEKFHKNNEIRKIEKEIEANYVDYLNKTCEKNKEEKEKLSKRLIYYKKDSLTYKSIIQDISRFDSSICEKFDNYTKKYNAYKLKVEQAEKAEKDEEFDEDEDN